MQRFQRQVLDQTPTLVSCADDHSVSTIEEVIPRPGGVYLNSCRETDDHRISAGEAEFSPRDHTPDRQDSGVSARQSGRYGRGCDGG